MRAHLPHDQRVAVASHAGDFRGCSRAACAGDVLNDDLLAERL